MVIAITVGVVLCIGVLILFVVFGLRRLFPRQQDDKQEMEWDNSSLNITVNPIIIDESNMFEVEVDTVILKQRNEINSEDEEPSEHPKEKELEWDNSTLMF